MPKRTDISSILVIGSGPIVIGQAAEFDYSGTQACRVLREEGYRVILVNSNPATIMTDPEFADATYVEPITPEFVEKVIAAEKPDALLATLGGQTALNTAISLHENGVLEKYGVELIGANVDAIQRGENREKFKEIVENLGEFSGSRPEVARSHICHSVDDVMAAAKDLGFPVVLRPSYTMGGVGAGFANAVGLAMAARREHGLLDEESILGWKEFELELMRDKSDNVVIVCSIENFDPMGVHTGDSITVAPAMTLTDREYQRMRDVGIAIIRAVGVDTGGCNIQFAIKDQVIYMIEANPRASRTVPFASKATGVPLAKAAARIMAGESIASLNLPSDERRLDHFSVKEAVMPFGRFPGADTVLGPEMKSTGEVMGIGGDFPSAYAKTQLAIDYSLPKSGKVFISVCDREKRNIVPIAHALQDLGFQIVSTGGTGRLLKANGLKVEITRKMQEQRPNIGDLIANGEIDLLINIPFGQETRGDSYHLRSAAVRYGICYVTTLAGANAMAQAISAVQEGRLEPVALQDLPQKDM